MWLWISLISRFWIPIECFQIIFIILPDWQLWNCLCTYFINNGDEGNYAIEFKVKIFMLFFPCFLQRYHSAVRKLLWIFRFWTFRQLHWSLRGLYGKSRCWVAGNHPERACGSVQRELTGTEGRSFSFRPDGCCWQDAGERILKWICKRHGVRSCCFP